VAEFVNAVNFPDGWPRLLTTKIYMFTIKPIAIVATKT
jgi:hypothetical protein